MNCHGNHENNKNANEPGKKHKRHLSHILMMALCCGAPIILLLLVPILIRNGSSGIASGLSVIAPFLCPLMMLFMIPMMFRGRKDKMNKSECCQNKQEIEE